MTTVSTNNSSSTASTSTSTAATSKLFENYDAFLSLLTTQLQNQNPLDPMDASEYTSQLVQYAAVEQQISTNSNLETLISATNANTNTLALGYLGNVVQVDSADAYSTGSGASWDVNLTGAASTLKLTITNADGDVVRTVTTTGASGDNLFKWDGLTDDGDTAAAGTYTLAVSAVDANNATIKSQISSYGRVTNIDTSGSTASLLITGLSVSLDDVLGVSTDMPS